MTDADSKKTKADKLPLEDFLSPTSANQKSWADMAEEDDDDLGDLPPPPGGFELPEKQPERKAEQKPAWADAPKKGDQGNNNNNNNAAYGSGRGGAPQFQNQRPDRRGPPPGGFQDRRGPPGGFQQQGGGPGPNQGRRPGGSDRKERQFIDRPPYIAYVGNLAFEARDRDIGNELFRNMDVKDVRIQIDRERNRSMGYGYVEFHNARSLQGALAMNGVLFMGRNIRVDLADDSGRPRDQRQGGSGRSAPQVREEVNQNWRSAPREPRGPPRQPRDVGAPDRARAPPKDVVPQKEKEEGSSSNADEAPKERPKLVLQKRSVDAPLNQAASTTKSNPFGQAKPRDETEYEQRRMEREKAKQGTEADAEAGEDTNSNTEAAADANTEATADDQTEGAAAKTNASGNQTYQARGGYNNGDRFNQGRSRYQQGGRGGGRFNNSGPSNFQGGDRRRPYDRSQGGPGGRRGGGGGDRGTRGDRNAVERSADGFISSKPNATVPKSAQVSNAKSKTESVISKNAFSALSIDDDDSE